ncbi:hypothetical protein [Sporosarcina sp. Te-1]|uniref:hypothetical protein n=1 Tax=Sporosarcina sp. Te-1 TaxID=2818390 RepID=UPI001A9E5749|nr:hypothetical protein [Sporosarcina sp. Te-1]QTD42753.1 hypothetical protein J3U78_08285 [Sporosarcina sp. Te-1]
MANIKKQLDGWIVTDAIGIGRPSEEHLDRSAATEKFMAGFVEENAVVNEEWKIIEMDGEEYRIWVEVY